VVYTSVNCIFQFSIILQTHEHITFAHTCHDLNVLQPLLNFVKRAVLIMINFVISY